MNFRNRALTRVSAGFVGLAAAGAFVSPALADEGIDVAVEAVGGSIGYMVGEKPAIFHLINNSDRDLEDVEFSVDLSGLDDRIAFDSISSIEDVNLACEGDEDSGVCAVDVLPRGARIALDFWLVPADPESVLEAGDYGEIRVTVNHPGDEKTDNNSATLPVKIENKLGADLSVVALDVDTKVVDYDEDEFPVFGGPLHPGEEGALLYTISNFGNLPVFAGVQITVELPEGVTFSYTEDECEYSDDNRKAVCTYKDLVMIPYDWREHEDIEYSYGYIFWNYVTVDADVEAPVTLADGVVTAVALEPELSVFKAGAEPKLPKNVVPLAQKGQEWFGEIDPSDNTDKFRVIVAGAGGGGGGLPVTGAQAGLIGGIGAAVVLAGVVLFLIARRRKVVLVTPGDEKSAE